MALSSVDVERRNAPEASAEPNAPAPDAAASLSRRYALRAADMRFLGPFSMHYMPTRGPRLSARLLLPSRYHGGALCRTNLLLNHNPLLPYPTRKDSPHL